MLQPKIQQQLNSATNLAKTMDASGYAAAQKSIVTEQAKIDANAEAMQRPESNLGNTLLSGAGIALEGAAGFAPLLMDKSMQKAENITDLKDMTTANTVALGLQGVKTGSQLGSLIAGPVGGAVGAAVGGIAGGITGLIKNRNAEKDWYEAQDEEYTKEMEAEHEERLKTYINTTSKKRIEAEYNLLNNQLGYYGR